MMNRFLVLLLCFISITFKAQLDTEHWFAPMFDRDIQDATRFGKGREYQYLYLSTNETNSFKVDIYNNNRIIKSVNISKGNPQKVLIERHYIITTDKAELFKSTSMGLYVKGEKRFYANLRFAVPDHAEIITSKGLAGVGTKFYTVIPPIRTSYNNLNFMTGIIATEDNTKVKVSGYRLDVKFTNHTYTPTRLEFTLNKGQSYIIEGAISENGIVNEGNRKGFNGAKIEADKPISITNGSFNGQYTNIGENSSDIIMDQSVPVDRLGKEFAIVKGNGKARMAWDKSLEGVLIVATENNTEIYTNNYGKVATLNEGESYFAPSSDYAIAGNGINPHYNFYVRATKNVYLYQLLAGVEHSPATLGFNYIPPLNCFLPENIGEIGMINDMTVDSYTTMPTKLNIITMKDAVVNVDRYPMKPEYGPFPLTGNNEWVTYSIPNVEGNINITSTKSVTAGIAAGNGVVGYGGYFAGFSTVPIIKKTGECIPNIVLEVEDIYNIYKTYEWFLNGKAIPNSNSNTYRPTQPGTYTVVVRNNSCLQTTAEFVVEDCATDGVINKTICSLETFPIAFAKDPSKIVDANSIAIIQNPTKGNASINRNNKTISYVASAANNVPRTDSFIYKFCEEGSPSTCETITVNLTINGIALNNATLNTCSVNGQTTYDLTKANVGAVNGVQLSYYFTNVISQANKIANPKQYTPTGNNNKVYVLGEFNGCVSIAEITLTQTNISLNRAVLNACSVNDTATFDLTQANIGNTTGLVISYHIFKTDAENNTNPINNPSSFISKGERIFVRASNGNCSTIVEIDLMLNSGIALQNTSLSACPINGVATFNLTQANIGNIQGGNVKYYHSLADLQAKSNEIQNPQNYTTAVSKTIYVSVSSANACSSTAEIQLILGEKPQINVNAYNAAHCDTNFDGRIEIDFSKITPMISNNPRYNIKYYASQSDADNDRNPLPNLWSYSQNTEVFVKAISPEGCSVVEKILFTIKGNLAVNSTAEQVVLCDTDFDGIVEVNLADYHRLFTTALVNATYYISLQDAQNERNPVRNIANVSDGNTYYLRLSNATDCPTIVSLQFKINKPKKSTTLKDLSVCKGEKATLDAGDGYTTYRWSNGETSQTITVGAGTYWVELTSPNGCVHRQEVKVTTIENPKIESVEIRDNTVIVNVVGGTPPYEYSLNGGAWQTSNVFTNLEQGKKYTVAVRSQNGCGEDTKDFVIMKLVNFISPNGDGLNDVIDYSALLTKKNAKFNIYDRYGALIFEGNTSNKFIWDGKVNNRTLPTASYWYVLEWQEEGSDAGMKTSSWILLKNRD